MKTLFQQEAYNEIIQRVEKLTPSSQRQWGKMDVAQMLAHCHVGIDMATGVLKPPRSFISYLLGRMFKKKFFDNAKPFPKNTPTDKVLLIKDAKNFEQEKQKLLIALKKFHEGGASHATTHPHSFFGKLTPEEWGFGQYTHISHHLRQFGV